MTCTEHKIRMGRDKTRILPVIGLSPRLLADFDLHPCSQWAAQLTCGIVHRATFGLGSMTGPTKPSIGCLTVASKQLSWFSATPSLFWNSVKIGLGVVRRYIVTKISKGPKFSKLSNPSKGVASIQSLMWWQSRSRTSSMTRKHFEEQSLLGKAFVMDSRSGSNPSRHWRDTLREEKPSLEKRKSIADGNTHQGYTVDTKFETQTCAFRIPAKWVPIWDPVSSGICVEPNE